MVGRGNVGEPSPLAANAHVGLGSNLGDRLASLRAAVTALGELEETRVVVTSGVFEALAVVPEGAAAQPEYLNAVVVLETRLPPRTLLSELLAIERRHGRVRTERWAARTLDLDLLAWVATGELRSATMDESGLVLPHPRALDRDFVLEPLAEVAPSLLLDGQTVAEHLAALPAAARTILRRLDEPLVLA
jgi:2-amino-4-hydroxy-6-hydroxymethyldihydropteridine diphosphokinase